jgi:hypothetical protein
MNVLALTILVSSCLAGTFIVCFAVEVLRSRRGSPERDSLLPLDSLPDHGANPPSTIPTSPTRP